jgi:predicted transcriptional regulator
MKNPSLRSLLVVGAVLVSPLLGSTEAGALPKEGKRARNARVTDVEGRVFELEAVKGKPVLIVYEDKESATQNVALKGDLAKLAKGDRYKTTVALAAVADVSSYDFWPAKGFVIDAIRAESKKQGTTIYCDWTGSFRSALELRRGVSSVVLLGRDGQVLFAAEGTVSKEGREKLVTLLRAQIEGA